MVVVDGKLYRRKRRGIRPEEIKTNIQRSFQQTDAVYRRRRLNLRTTVPLTVAEAVMHLVVLLGLSTGTTAPEISSLWRDRARPAQVGYPVNIGGHIA